MSSPTPSDIRQHVHDLLPADTLLGDEILSSLPHNVMAIPETCGVLSDKELAITALDATGVRDAIAAGQLTCVEVVSAFGRRAAVAHQLVNCLVDFFLEDAIADAAALDAQFAQSGVVGPLHGVPISIKEHISMKGRWTSTGFKSGLHRPDEDADLVAILRRLGAVFYVKTNQPQTIMHLETNSVHGRTLNPHNLRLTPGGSSGGESSLVALRGSCMGIGTDGGGSIRNPAGNVGIYGFRPTTNTMPLGGYEFYMPGCDSFGISTGPMCSSRRDIDLLMSAVRGAEPHVADPKLFPQPWTKVEAPAKLRVGVMRHDGVVLPQPPMLRAFDHAVAKLRASGRVDVVEFKPYQQRHGYDTLRALYFEDGGANIKAALKAGGEEPLELTSWLIDTPLVAEHNVWESWKLRDTRDAFNKGYAAHWNASGIDVLLCPPFPGPACPHDTARYWGYTAVYNLLDYPGIVFPTGLAADAGIDVKPERSDFIADAEGSDEYNHKIYDPEVYHDAPLGLQLLARRFKDLELFAALEVVEDIIKGA